MPTTPKKPAKKKTAKRKAAAPKRKAATKPAAPSNSRGKKAKKRGGRVGRPAFKPTDEDRRRVELLSALLPQDEISQLIINPTTGKPIEDDTLRRHFRHELDTGKAKVDAKIGQSLVQRALDHSHPQGATCAIFYAKTRMGWIENQRVEVDHKAGVLVAPAAASVEDWLTTVATQNARAVEPGLVEPD